MLKVYVGPDTKKAEAAYLAQCQKLEKDNPGLKIIALDQEDLDPVFAVAECISSQDLFGAGILCRGRRVLGALADIEPGDLAGSQTHFVFFEPELKAAELKSYKKYLESCGTANVSKKFDAKGGSFVITEKLLDKDKRALWVEYERQLFAGVDPEDLYFKLQWQTRSVLAARASKSAEEAGLHPFVYGKSKRAADKFAEGELEKMTNNLLTVWHMGHGGGQDFELSLENFILNM